MLKPRSMDEVFVTYCVVLPFRVSACHYKKKYVFSFPVFLSSYAVCSFPLFGEVDTGHVIGGGGGGL